MRRNASNDPEEPVTLPADSPDLVDGRIRRGARNREAIVSALIELVREGDLRPTAEVVARRAGVGTRTVFRHFDDMESLHAELNAKIEAEVQPLLARPIEGGTKEQRLRALVERRCVLYERIAPFKRSANLHRWRSPYLQGQHTRLLGRLREGLVSVLPELDREPDRIVQALDMVTSFEAWDRLRSDQHLGRERAEAAITAAALALLGP